MRRRSWRSAWLCAFTIGLALSTPVEAACQKTVALRADADGRKIPYHVVRCDESDPVALLEPGAHFTLCDPKALAETGARFEDCAGAVDAARGALRKAKLRAGLRDGQSDEELVQRYGASQAELDALRVGVER